jgi:hypothetical protein
MLAQHFEKQVQHMKSLWFLEQMTEKKSTTHVLIARQLLIAQREHSSIWQCRYSIDGRWQRTSTGEREKRILFCIAYSTTSTSQSSYQLHAQRKKID